MTCEYVIISWKMSKEKLWTSDAYTHSLIYKVLSLILNELNAEVIISNCVWLNVDTFSCYESNYLPMCRNEKRKAKWCLMLKSLQVNREDNTQCHQHGLLQLPRFRWEQRWFPENGGRHNATVRGWGLQHQTGNRWVCGQRAVVQMKTKLVELKLVLTRAFVFSWAKWDPPHDSS